MNTSLSETVKLENWRMLIVDDQQDNLSLAGAVFNARGAEVQLANSARTALTILEDYEPTVILLDLAMPEMDGWELVKAIRADERYNQIPVIALSVRLSITDNEKAREGGFDGYIAKPFSVANVVSQIQEIVESRNATMG